jgi:hypothetical protein
MADCSTREEDSVHDTSDTISVNSADYQFESTWEYLKRLGIRPLNVRSEILAREWTGAPFEFLSRCLLLRAGYIART